MSGYRSFSSCVARSHDSAVEPRKNTGRPSAAQRAKSGSNMSLPDTLVDSGRRSRREAMMSGMPSGRDRNERRYASASAGDRCAMAMWSTLGVRTKPPRPLWARSTIRSSASFWSTPWA